MISELLDSTTEISELAWQDLREQGRHGGAASGAKGLTAEQVIRALIIKPMNDFSYRRLAFHLADSSTYRTFCRLSTCAASPKKSALAASIKALRPETLEAIHRRIVEIAVKRGVDAGHRLRVDATVVESNIHHPTDSELLWDCVRVLTRLMKKAQLILGVEVFRVPDRRRRAKKRRREIATARRKSQRVKPYRDLLGVTEEVRSFAEEAIAVLRESGDPRASQLVAKLECYLERSARVVDQSRRRVLEGESVPATEKLVSIFEEHTDIIRKDARDTFYGHKICLTAGSSSLVFDCQVLDGNPADSTLTVPTIKRFVEARGTPPRQVVFDGAFSSKQNLAEIKALGTDDVVFSKSRGIEVSEMAKSSWVYRTLRNFRAGIEGIISFLKRAFGLDRCTWKSLPSFKSYIWSSILTSNLLVTARHLLKST
jgi:IS5 family transposase